MAGNPTTEQIDERILGLLGLQDEYELSYDEYVRNLKEAMVASRMSKSKFSTEESELVTTEWKRVKGKKGRFRPKKKKITVGGLGIGKGLASPLKITKQKLLLPGGKDFKGKEPIGVKKEDNVLLRISNTLDSILQTLIDTNKENKKKLEKERIGSEEAKRAGREKDLESKPFEGIKKALSTIVKPFQSILDRIINFITMALLGRAMIKLFDWFTNPDNKEKIQSIIRFFKDHWPVLLALYLRFGTGFGRAVGTLSKIVIKGAIKLAAATAKLVGLGAASKFLGGRGGKVLSAGLQVGAVVAGSAAIENLAGGGGNKEQPTPKVEGRAGGGSIKIPNFKGGGFNFGGFGNMFNGVVKGKKGVDKIPAMLSDGEFVMSAGAVRKHGVDTLEAMNAAGGGTNQPKMISGVPHAYGGGYITSTGREDSRANYDKEYGEGSYNKKLAEKRAKSASEDDSDIARRKMLQSSNNRPARKSSGKKKSSGPTKITVNELNVTPLAGLAGSMKGMGPNVKITRNSGPDAMRPDMQRKLAEENKKSSAIDTSRAKEANLHKQASSEYNKIINNPDDPRYDAAWNGNLKVADIRKQLQAKETTTPKASATPSPQSAYRAAGMGNYSAANVRRAQSAAGVGVNVGAKMVGGYGLKQQGFKQSPSSQIIKDANGKNVVGYKAMKGGKLTYVQGKKPGEGTSNIWEKMGRAINPNAYKQSDAVAAQKKYQEASAGSIQSLKDRGASQATIAKRQKELKKGVKPLPARPRTRFENPNRPGAGGGGYGGGHSSGGQKVPSGSATHPKGTRTAQAVLGANKK